MSATTGLLSCISSLLFIITSIPVSILYFPPFNKRCSFPRYALWQDHRHLFFSLAMYSGGAIPFVVSCTLSFYFLFSLSLYALQAPPGKASTAVCPLWPTRSVYLSPIKVVCSPLLFRIGVSHSPPLWLLLFSYGRAGWNVVKFASWNIWRFSSRLCFICRGLVLDEGDIFLASVSWSLPIMK